jgi:hypothetical protein
MCIVGDGEILTATEDLRVYKVMTYTHRRTVLTKTTVKGKITFVRSAKKLSRKKARACQTPFISLKEEHMLTRDATRFDRGAPPAQLPGGYGCFASLKEANDYLKKITQGMGDYASMYFVKKYRIPEGSRYEYGSVRTGLMGGGLPAMRAERLTKY